MARMLRADEGVLSLHATGSVAVVVPTRHEAGNVAPLIERLTTALEGIPFELIFVDDSDDDTPEVIRRLAGSNRSASIRVIHRNKNQRSGGLGGAVIAGFKATDANWVCVMDGDLQHPPELVRSLIETAQAEEKDLVLASRYANGGGTEGLGPVRTAISLTLLKMAQFIFPRQLRDVSDPLTGFFIVRRDAVAINELRPSGFKILLEILVRSDALRVGEIPFTIQDRFDGDSKASAQEVQRYFKLLTRLRIERSSFLLKFMAVGAFGLLVNTAALALLTENLGLHYLLSALLATQVSTLSNFLLTERWVFGARRAGNSAVFRLMVFFAVNELALLGRGPVLIGLVEGLGLNYLIGNIVTLLAFMLLRFKLSDKWLWAERDSKPVHSYDIHGVISVSSEVSLPELLEFKRASLTGPADIVVQRMRGKSLSPGKGSVEGVLSYREAVGRTGFAMDIDYRDTQQVKVSASSFLCRSPHVLYTNVVEPILRWSFSERGYALIHGACVADGAKGILVTARTDTGKTTTVLKVLDNFPLNFLSDDLTLMGSDGTLLNYPKPMTISRHTLHAVRTPLLSVWQRAALVLQSRVHSRSGRKFAHFLARTGIPVATVNMIAQFVIPPPKYSVRKLVPDVSIGEKARLSALVVIERGQSSLRSLDSDEAFSLLMSNTEDAYGFPPYHQIEGFLRSRGTLDLRGQEAEIVRAAIGTIEEAFAVSSPDYDWWRYLPINVGARPRAGMPQMLSKPQGPV